MTLRRVACLLLIFAFLSSAAEPAWAAGGPGPGGGGSGSGSLGPSGVGSGAVAPGGNADESDSYTTPSPNPPPSDQSGYTYVSEGLNDTIVCLDNGTMMPVGGTPPPGVDVLGPIENPTGFQLYGPTNEPVGNIDYVCPSVAIPAAPPPPPPPPTPAEVWAATPLPANHIDLNPVTLGLTQLPTWMWFTGPGGAVTATVNIRGYVVTTTAHPVAAYWWFGDGGSGQGAVGGTEAQPSATHTYVNVGHYTVRLIVAWSGQYTFAGNGVPAETVPLGTVDGAATTAPYGVQEVRSVGVTPGSGQ